MVWHGVYDGGRERGIACATIYSRSTAAVESSRTVQQRKKTRAMEKLKTEAVWRDVKWPWRAAEGAGQNQGILNGRSSEAGLVLGWYQSLMYLLASSKTRNGGEGKRVQMSRRHTHCRRPRGRCCSGRPRLPPAVPAIDRIHARSLSNVRRHPNIISTQLLQRRAMLR